MRKQTQFPLLAVVLSIAASALGQQQPLTVGKPLPIISATAASGRWLERAALNPATFGKVRGVSPGTSREAKIVVYTPTLSEEFFRLAREVDQLVAKHPELAWSFVQVSDPKGAQYGGYTADELVARLGAIKALTEKQKLSHLSFLVAAPSAQPSDTTITLAFVKPGTDSSQRPLVVWTAQGDAAKLDRATITKWISELSATIGK